jgi:uncharacterized membrane protein YqjE
VSDETPGYAPAGGLRRALARVGVAMVELARTRLELAALDFSEERERTKLRLILAIVAATFLAFAVLCASALIVVMFWDTHRIAAIGAVTAAHFAIGAGALLRLRASQRTAPPPFQASLAELERDRQWLAGELRDGLGR